MIFRLRKYAFFIILFLTAAIFFYPVIFQKKDALPTDALLGAHVPWVENKWPGYPAGVPIKNLEITDSISQFYPWKSLVAEFWRNGKVPLWNPYMFNGYPLLANLHSAALYPLNFLYLFFSNITAWNILVFLQVFLSLLFMYLLLKELKLGGIASFFGAVTYAFSGYMIAWLEFTTGGHAALWLPLLFYLILKIKDPANLKYAFLMPFIFAFIYLAGDFQAPLYITLVFLFYGVLQLFRRQYKYFKLMILTWIAGIGLASIQLIPTLDLFTKSIRFDDPRLQDYMFGIMGWKRVVNLFWPDFFGNVVTGNYWAEWGYHEYMCYTGILSVVLLISGIFRNKEYFEKFIWLTLIISLLLVFPFPTAFLPYILKIPGLSTSSASRIVMLVDFCIGILSAYSLNYILKTKKYKNLLKSLYLILLITAGVITGLMLSIFIMKNGGMDPDAKIMENLKVSIKNMIPQTFIVLLALILLLVYGKLKRIPKGLKISNKNIKKGFTLIIGLLVFMHTADVLRYAWKNTPFSKREFLYPKTSTIQFLLDDNDVFRIAGPGFPLNYFVEYKIESAEGYDPIYPYMNGLWYSIVNLSDKSNPSRRYGEIKNYLSDEINYANIKYIVDYKKNPFNNILDSNGTYQSGLNDTDKFTKVFEESRIAVFKNNDYLPRVFLFTDFNDPQGTRVTGGFEDDYEKAGYSISEYKNDFNGISLVLNSKHESNLFLSQSNYQGWKAYVNNNETEIKTIRELFQSIRVPEGVSKISFVYCPEAFIIGKYISLISLAIIVLLCIYEKQHKKTRN